MEAQTINIKDISHKMTINEVIRMVLKGDVTDLSRYALFVVEEGKKEKRVKTKETLYKLLEENTNSAILSVKRKLKTKTKGSAVLKVKNTFNRLKTIFSRESSRQQNNLIFTRTRNTNDAKNNVSKGAGDKLTDIENMLQSETIWMTRTPKAEMFGKVELFRRFMKDVNDSTNDANETINEVDSAFKDVNNSINDVRTSQFEDINKFEYVREHTYEQTKYVHSSADLQEISDATGAASIFNEAFTQLSGQGSLFLEAGNDTTDNNEQLNHAFARRDNTFTVLNKRIDTNDLTTKLNEAFITSYISVPLLKYGTKYTSMHQDEATVGMNGTILVSDYTDILNECVVFNESSYSSECSESAFGDDNEIDDLERNIFDEDLLSNVGDIRIFFNDSCPESTDDAIDSFMKSVAINHDDDEGLSSMGSDATGE